MPRTLSSPGSARCVPVLVNKLNVGRDGGTHTRPPPQQGSRESQRCSPQGQARLRRGERREVGHLAAGGEPGIWWSVWTCPQTLYPEVPPARVSRLLIFLQPVRLGVPVVRTRASVAHQHTRWLSGYFLSGHGGIFFFFRDGKKWSFGSPLQIERNLQV